MELDIEKYIISDESRTSFGQLSDSDTRTDWRICVHFPFPYPCSFPYPTCLTLSDLSDVRLLSNMSDMSDTVRLLSDLSETPGPAETSRTGHSDGCPVRLVRLKSDSDTSHKIYPKLPLFVGKFSFLRIFYGRRLYGKLFSVPVNFSLSTEYVILWFAY